MTTPSVDQLLFRALTDPVFCEELAANCGRLPKNSEALGGELAEVDRHDIAVVEAAAQTVAAALRRSRFGYVGG